MRTSRKKEKLWCFKISHIDMGALTYVDSSLMTHLRDDITISCPSVHQ